MNKNYILCAIALLFCTFAQVFSQDAIEYASFDSIVTAQAGVNVTRFIYNLTDTSFQEQLYVDIIAPEDSVSFSISKTTPTTPANYVYLNGVALDQTLYQFAFTPSYTSNPIFNIVIHYYWAHETVLNSKNINPESLRFTVAQTSGQTTGYTLFQSDETVLNLLTTTASQPSASTIRNDFNSTEPIGFAIQAAVAGSQPPQPTPTTVTPQPTIKGTTSTTVPKSSGTTKPSSSSQPLPQKTTTTPTTNATVQNTITTAAIVLALTMLL